jgi:hypothetical protein
MGYSEIVAAIRQRLLDAMQADLGRHYTLDRCEVFPFPNGDLLDPTYGQTLAMLIPDRETTTESLGRIVEKEAFADLIVARRIDADVLGWQKDQIYDDGPTVQNYLVEDVEYALFGADEDGAYWDYTALAENIEIVAVDRSIERAVVDGWAVVFMSVRMQWEQQW